MKVKSKRNLSSDKIVRVAEILKTIGHPIRLQVLGLLELNEPMNVSEIQENIEVTVEQSLLSHHLIKMKDKGLLRSEKEGMRVYYRLADRQILNIFDCMEKCDI